MHSQSFSEHHIATEVQPTHSRSASSGSLPRPPTMHQNPFQPFSPDTPESSAALAMQSMYQDSGMNASYNDLTSPYPLNQQQQQHQQQQTSFFGPYGWTNNQFINTPLDTGQFGNMLIETQDVDASLLGLQMLPWLDVPPGSEMITLFDAKTPQSLSNMTSSPGTQNPASRPSNSHG